MIIRNKTAQMFATTFEKQRIVLKPGVNDVDPKAWASWRETKVMAHYLEEGKIVEPKDAAEKEPEVKTLKGLNVKDSIALVKATFDQELLGKWIEAEQRENVLKAMEKQLEAIAIKAEKDEANEDDTEGDDAEKPES